MLILTTATQDYVHTFGNYVNQFLLWGQKIFFGLLILNIVWIALWHAFSQNTISESFGAFVKRFFVVAFFYTLMLHVDWLVSILQSAKFMGETLTGAPIDPSSIIEQGIGVANKLLIPIHHANLLTSFFGILVGFAVCVVVLFCFISVALDLSVTLIITTALISLSPFFLSFAALSNTCQIAKQTLDAILAHCIKLLGIYLVVAAGSQTITLVTMSMPETVKNFDAYSWLIAVVVLFWLLAKQLPNQLARLISGLVQESQSSDVGALMMSGVQMGKSLASHKMMPAKAATQFSQATGFHALGIDGGNKAFSGGSSAAGTLHQNGNGQKPNTASFTDKLKQMNNQRKN